MENASLIQHYLEYLRSPAVLLTILILTGPVLLEWFKNKRLPTGPVKKGVTGCFRLGLAKRSNLHDQFEPESDVAAKSNEPDSSSATPRIKALFTYPIKSCRGVELAASEIGPTGLKYDRLFTFAQSVSKTKKKDTETEDDNRETHEWRFVTQREFPRLALLQTELWVPDPRKTKQSNKAKKKAGAVADDERQAIEEWSANGGCVTIRFPYEPSFNPFGLFTEDITLRLPLVPTSQRARVKDYSIEPLSIWIDCPEAVNVSNEIPAQDFAKLKQFLGVKNPFAIFRVDDRSLRAIVRSLPKDRPDESYSVGFADAFPIHMLSMSSIHSIASEQPQKRQGKLEARRFRANIYLTNTPAFSEDTWKRITAGRCIRTRSESNGSNPRVVEMDGEYHIACRTARCKLPNVHPSTGVKDVNEPYATMAKSRKVDEGAFPHPCLGMQMIPLFRQGILRVGDEIEVVETGEHVYEKMFAGE